MKKFLFQDDSITDAGRHLYGWDDALVQGYPAVVSAMIDTVHPGDIEFINRAKGRDCIVEIYAHIKEDIINAY